MNRATLLAAGLAGTLAAFVTATAAEAACERHIVNRSNQPWTFKNDRGAGNVWFESDHCGDSRRNGYCKIPPHTTIQIKYTSEDGTSRGTMRIFDHTGKMRSFSFEGLYRCPYIEHRGNTGAVAVNDPARGDWNAWGDQW